MFCFLLHAKCGSASSASLCSVLCRFGFFSNHFLLFFLAEEDEEKKAKESSRNEPGDVEVNKMEGRERGV